MKKNIILFIFSLLLIQGCTMDERTVPDSEYKSYYNNDTIEQVSGVSDPTDPGNNFDPRDTLQSGPTLNLTTSNFGEYTFYREEDIIYDYVLDKRNSRDYFFRLSSKSLNGGSYNLTIKLEPIWDQLRENYIYRSMSSFTSFNRFYHNNGSYPNPYTIKNPDKHSYNYFELEFFSFHKYLITGNLSYTITDEYKIMHSMELYFVIVARPGEELTNF